MGVSLTAQNIELKHLDVVIFNSIIEFDDKLWVFGEGRKTGNTPSPYNVLCSSDNGKNWDIKVSNNGSINMYSKTVVFNDKLYSIAGHPDNITNEIKTSDDGISWESHTPSFSPRKTHAALVHNDQLYIIAGSGLNDVWRSKDGKKWEKVCSSISADFPHFWRPKVVSLNNKLILFGGSKTDWGFDNNRKGVYISNDHGSSWKKIEIPYDVDLAESQIHFVKDNKLWIEVSISMYRNSSVGFVNNRQEHRFISTTDGESWQLEANRDQEVFKKSGARLKTVSFKKDILVFQETDKETTITKFHEPGIYIDPLEGIIKRQSEERLSKIALNVSHLNQSFNGQLSYLANSSNQNIVKNRDLEISNGELSLTSTGKVGETKITITVSDGTIECSEQFRYFTYPNGKTYLRELSNINIDLNSKFPGQHLVRSDANGYGQNRYEIHSSDNDFMPHSNISVLNLLAYEILSFDNVVTSKAGETQVTVTASDGVSSFSRTIWLKIGADLPPVSVGNLKDYPYTTGDKFNYCLPENAFSEPEGQKLSYFSHDLPDGLTLDPNTGDIYGRTIKSTPFEINIEARDRYGKAATQTLKVVEMLKVSVPENRLDKIKLYPNPCSGQLHVLNENNKGGIYQIYSKQGLLLMEKSLKSGTNIIDVSWIKSGTYIIKLKRDQDLMVQKFIKI